MDYFLWHFRRANGTYPTSITALLKTVALYPTLFHFGADEFGAPMLAVLQRDVLEVMVNWASVERHFKRCGLYVVQTTHKEKHAWKVWKLHLEEFCMTDSADETAEMIRRANE